MKINIPEINLIAALSLSFLLKMTLFFRTFPNDTNKTETHHKMHPSTSQRQRHSIRTIIPIVSF